MLVLDLVTRAHPCSTARFNSASSIRLRMGAGPLVVPDDVAPVFGVELLGKRCRADKVAKENRGTTTPAKLFAGLRWGTTRGTSHRQRRAAFRAEAAVGAVVWLQDGHRIAGDAGMKWQDSG